MGEFGLSQPVRRREDDRLLTGAGRFTDDINLEGQARAVLVRSPHARAKIIRIATAATAATITTKTSKTITATADILREYNRRVS